VRYAQGGVQAKVFFLCIAGAGQEVVESVEASLAGRHSCQSGSLESVVEQLAADKSGTCGGAIVLQLVEEAGFGGSLSGVGFGGGQGVEDEGGEGQLGGKRRGGEGEEGREEV